MASKFLRDNAIVSEIIERGEFTQADKTTLLQILQVSYHDSGKIEGLSSIDGSAVNCEFCKGMQTAAETDPTIVCGGCYAKALDEYRVSAEARHWLNQRILSAVLFTVEELRNVYAPSLRVRFNSDGDFSGSVQAINSVRFCKAHPENRIAIWTKNLPAIRTAIEQEGKPANLKIVYSSCRLEEARVDLFELYPWIDYVFTVYATKEATKEAIANGANECNGRKCRECGFRCYDGTWQIHTNIAEYLRGVSKVKRAELVAAVQARKANA